MSDNTVLEKPLALVQRLHGRTRENKADWQATDVENRFVVQLGQFAIAIRSIPDPDYPNEPDFELVIVDESTARIVERITNAMLRPMMDRLTAEGLNPYNLMVDTFEMARRRALGVDDALEKILQNLAEE